MSAKEKYIRGTGCSVFIFALLFLGLLARLNSDRDASSQKPGIPPTENSVIQISATPNPSVQLQVLHRCWITNQGSLRILSFAETQHSESKLARQKIALFNCIRRSFADIPVPMICCQLYPAEKDYLQVLG